MSYTRRTELTCTQAELTTCADTVLLANELLAVVKSSGRRDIYYGDGTTPISGLSPSVSYDELNALKTAAATSEANAASSATEAANSAASLVVVNDLVTGGTTNALSAEQGKALSASISELSTRTMKAVDQSDGKSYSMQLTIDTDGFPVAAFTTIE